MLSFGKRNFDTRGLHRKLLLTVGFVTRVPPMHQNVGFPVPRKPGAQPIWHVVLWVSVPPGVQFPGAVFDPNDAGSVQLSVAGKTRDQP